MVARYALALPPRQESLERDAGLALEREFKASKGGYACRLWNKAAEQLIAGDMFSIDIKKMSGLPLKAFAPTTKQRTIEMTLSADV